MNYMLKPCPFCGDAGKILSQDDDDIHIVGCQNHDNDVSVKAYGNGIDEAIGNWNKRYQTSDGETE